MFRWFKSKFFSSGKNEAPEVFRQTTTTRRTAGEELTGQPKKQGQIERTYEDLRANLDLRTDEYKYLSSAALEHNPRLTHWIGCSDYSGFVREKCLRFIIKYFQRGDEECILLRLSDWVPQIREIASDWIIENFSTLPLTSIYRSQRVILYLSRKANMPSQVAYKFIVKDLMQRSGELEDAEFFKFDPNFRRYLYRVSMAGEQVLRRLILLDKDPRNRLLLLTLLKNVGRLTDSEAECFKHDPSALVRRRYLYYLLAEGITPSEDLLWPMALHKSRGMRELGQYYLDKFYHRDVYADYKARRDEAFYYIADFAKPCDADLFVKGVREGNKRVRIMCLKALAVTDLSRIKELGVSALLGSSSDEKAIICSVLPDIMTLSEIRDLRSMIEGGSKYGCMRYLSLIGKKSFWALLNDGLDYLLDEGADRGICEQYLNTVMYKNSIFEKLDAELGLEIETKLQMLEQMSDGKYAGWIQHVRFVKKNA